MKPIKFALLSLVCILASAYSSYIAQEKKTMQDILMSYRWVEESSIGQPNEYSLSFDGKIQTSTSCYEDSDTLINYMSYYFSDELVEKFDHKKIGKTTSGKYLILFVHKCKDLLMSEIIQLSEKSVTFKSANKDHIGGGTRTFIAKPKEL